MMVKNPCVIDYPRSNNELLRTITIDKNIIELTFGYSPSSQELSNCACQHILGYKQRTDEQRKAILYKRQQWIRYTHFNPTVCLSHLLAWNVWMNRDPSTEKDGGKATPNNAPDGATTSGNRGDPGFSSQV